MITPKDVEQCRKNNVDTMTKAVMSVGVATGNIVKDLEKGMKSREVTVKYSDQLSISIIQSICTEWKRDWFIKRTEQMYEELVSGMSHLEIAQRHDLSKIEVGLQLHKLIGQKAYTKYISKPVEDTPVLYSKKIEVTTSYKIREVFDLYGKMKEGACLGELLSTQITSKERVFIIDPTKVAIEVTSIHIKNDKKLVVHVDILDTPMGRLLVWDKNIRVKPRALGHKRNGITTLTKLITFDVFMNKKV